ncbi:hypothetical protein DFJ58DRAFT_846841 [Suillus subalutaceus]|uniref:uncharacterized protein n=1 Tax=Suillus subalutaceus TaxID=48586 RepID=UPI001B86A3C1|nr:uncharacterized protein DFJ58DRAFT_846841 [Suillus subalutaceus]KAG1836692.1 hypothetical protein DFJ58DRAFT_846841 [Suillus subalutaceus]
MVYVTLHNAKHIRLEAPSALKDPAAWAILEHFLTTELTYTDMEDQFCTYLSDRHHQSDWINVRVALFSDDGNDKVALANLHLEKLKHLVEPPKKLEILSLISKQGREGVMRIKRMKRMTLISCTNITITLGFDQSLILDYLCEAGLPASPGLKADSAGTPGQAGTGTRVRVRCC